MSINQYQGYLFGGPLDPTLALTRGVEFGFYANVDEVLLQAPGESWPVC